MDTTQARSADFDAVSKKEWQDKIAKDLKGKPLEDLRWHLEEHLTLDAIYHPEDRSENSPVITDHRSSNDWEIGEDIVVRVIKQANRQALRALEQGVNAPRFVLTQIYTEMEMKNLLHDLEADIVSIHFCEKQGYKTGKSVDVLKNFLDIITKQAKDTASIQGSYNMDMEEMNMEELEEVLTFAKAQLPAFRVLTVNATPFFASPTNTTTELAQTIALANDWLTDFIKRGYSLEDINDQLQFSVATGTSYFVEIAKLRALRLLWANVLQAHGAAQVTLPPIEVHFAESAQTENTYDNMIRSTTQALSAVIGGANRLTVIPANATKEEPTDFTRRIARNVQHLLKLEGHTNRVLDPAAGSYYVEQLTEKLAEEAWKKFQQMAG